MLNRAARVMAAGHGGQILLDGATEGLLSGDDLVDMGSHRLRDLAKPVELFQVRALFSYGLAYRDAEPAGAYAALRRGLAVRHCYDSGNVFLLPFSLAILAALLDRLGHHEPAATISGFSATPMTRSGYPEVNTMIAHLRESLGGEGYESLAHAGAQMTRADIATYAFDQIDRARAALA